MVLRHLFICFALNIHVMKWGDARNTNLVPNVQLFGSVTHFEFWTAVIIFDLSTSLAFL